jgi:NAD(P)-dependent dehydrogenase (short-subunit alcohol dehydrogenase family)
VANQFIERLFDLSGQTAVVIGGTGVLCGAMAEGIAQAGAFVIVAGRDEARGRARVEAIKKLGGDGAFVLVDVTSRSSIEQLLAGTLKLRGQVDMLVNGAGVNAASTYFDIPDEVWDRVMDSNLKSTHFGCQVFGRHMADSGRGGAILNVGSVTSDKPLSRVIAYSTSKAAVISLTQNVGRELAPFNVRVNAICPGFFPAEQNRKILTEDRVKNIMAGTPMKRYGEPDELIGCTLLLLSRTAGSFITGAAYYVDGGFTASRF